VNSSGGQFWKRLRYIKDCNRRRRRRREDEGEEDEKRKNKRKDEENNIIDIKDRWKVLTHKSTPLNETAVCIRWSEL
jgi:hypothetical protein